LFVDRWWHKRTATIAVLGEGSVATEPRYEKCLDLDDNLVGVTVKMTIPVYDRNGKKSSWPAGQLEGHVFAPKKIIVAEETAEEMIKREEEKIFSLHEGEFRAGNGGPCPICNAPYGCGHFGA